MEHPLAIAVIDAVRLIFDSWGRVAARKLLILLVWLIFDSWGRVAARKLLILLVWGTDFSKV